MNHYYIQKWYGYNWQYLSFESSILWGKVSSFTSKKKTRSYPDGARKCHSQVMLGSYPMGYPGDSIVSSSPGVSSTGGPPHSDITKCRNAK